MHRFSGLSLPDGKILFYNNSLYYSTNSVLNASISIGTYTGNDTPTRIINVSNGKYLILCCPASNLYNNWKYQNLIFIQHGTYTFHLNNAVYYNVTFDNNTIYIENQNNMTYMNVRNQIYLWTIFT